MSRVMTIFLLTIAPLMALSLTCLGLETTRSNALGWFLLFMGGAYIIGGPLYVWKQKSKLPAQKEERGDRSFWLVQPGFFCAIFGAPLEYLYLPEILPRTTWFQIAGVVLVAISVVMHSRARQAIRGQFSGHIQIQPEHRLVQSGPYRYIRHPGYLGYLLMALGIAVGYSSLVSCGAVIVLLIPGLIYRIKVEEKLLVDEYGDEYRWYAHKTKRLIPGLW
jgi:protein-S-isoprenylcysteine O-methyltransferase Ste14